MNPLQRPNRILVTGASGFIGKSLIGTLAQNGYCVYATTRRDSSDFPENENTHWISCGDLADICRDKRFPEVESIIHLAGRAHILKETSANPLEEFRRVNVQNTKLLAETAAQYGVQRFVFISSIGVNGNVTQERPFTEDSIPAPHNSYAISKHEAEKILYEISENSGIKVSIIRPPLVYGPGVKANFLNMMKWIDKGIPLPLGAIRNKRSLVALDNLVDFLINCLTDPRAENQTFLISDDNDVSTPELIHKTAAGLGKKARLLPVPKSVLRNVGTMLRKRSMVDQLCESLQLNIDKAKQRLNWSPPISVDEGLKKTTEYFLAEKTNHNL